MTKYYSLNKCKSITFLKNIDNFDLIYTKNKDFPKENIYAIGLDLFPSFNEIDLNKHIVLVINTLSEMFNDIEIKTDENKAGKTSNEIKPVQNGAITEDLLGNENSLSAISDNLFAVSSGKREAYITPLNIKQDHGVIDTIAKNGILVCPTEINSIQTLMDKLATLKSFDIVFIHPWCKIQCSHDKYPLNSPAYTIGKERSEILAIFFRYIIINFFGYMNISDNENKFDYL